MHQAMAAAYPSSLVPNSVPGHGGYSPSSGLASGHGGRSPVSSPTPQPPTSMTTPSGHPMGGPGGYPSSGAGQGGLNTSGNDGGMSSDCSDDEGSPGGPGPGGNIIIHPWMKKIHVAGAGKSSSTKSWKCNNVDLDILIITSFTWEWGYFISCSFWLQLSTFSPDSKVIYPKDMLFAPVSNSDIWKLTKCSKF